MAGLPEYYFRARPAGAAMYKIGTDPRARRMEMNRIAGINLSNGQVNVQEGHDLTEHEQALIETWIKARRATLRQRANQDVDRALDAINLTAHWAQFDAKPDQLDAVTDALLLAMHDLREVLVRKRAHRHAGSEPAPLPKGRRAKITLAAKTTTDD
jgi:hypothetical protein